MARRFRPPTENPITIQILFAVLALGLIVLWVKTQAEWHPGRPWWSQPRSLEFLGFGVILVVSTVIGVLRRGKRRG